MVEGILALSMVIIAVIGGIIIILYLRKTLNIERMALIERGKDLKELWAPDRPSTALHIALVMIGGGIGLLVGDWLDHVANTEEVGYFAALFIFGGIGLVVAYIIDERKREHREAKQRSGL
jgi:O-antigen/teichoic acid export membrane protein